MAETATITSKRQLTIPVALFRAAQLKEGQKVIISHVQGALYVEPAKKLVNELAGSVKISPVLRGKSIDIMIQEAKKKHFQKR